MPGGGWPRDWSICVISRWLCSAGHGAGSQSHCRSPGRSAPLDVIVVRKLGVPFQPELGMGAVGDDGVRVINREVVRLAGASTGPAAALWAAAEPGAGIAAVVSRTALIR